jgi:hypothetical protein
MSGGDEPAFDSEGIWVAVINARKKPTDVGFLSARGMFA